MRGSVLAGVVETAAEMRAEGGMAEAAMDANAAW
jgi:hypothetical protein